MTCDVQPVFLVCEDGDEYTDRFKRFLGREFRFVRVPNASIADDASRAGAVSGLLLDLDFRRSDPCDLVGELGLVTGSPSAEERSRWSAVQGILILQYLRSRAVTLPALLFADLDDPAQVAYLERSLAPLSIVSSREGLAQIAARLRLIAGSNR